MQIRRALGAFAVVLGMTGGVGACGGDDDKGGGGSSAKLDSCKKVCEKIAAAKCLIELPIDFCKSLCDLHAQKSATCQDALKAVSDCQLEQSDICSAPGCDEQEQAYQSACGT